MKKYTLFVGIDVHKKTLDVMIGGTEDQLLFRQFTNDAAGINQLLELIGSMECNDSLVLVCCENTGSYLHKLAMVLKTTAMTLWAVHPLLMKYFSIDLNRFKIDKADARKLWLYAHLHQQRAVNYHLPDIAQQFLKELFQLRKQLVHTRAQWLNRIDDQHCKAFTHPLAAVMTGQIKSYFSDMIKVIDREITQLIAANDEFKNIYHILLSVPGIGPVVAQHLIIVTDGFRRFSNWKALASYIGTAPFPRQSGTSIKERWRTSQQAYKPLKTDIHQGVVSICRPGQLFHHYYQFMRSQNKHPLYIFNAIKNMILKILFHLVKNNSLFDLQVFLAHKNSWQKNLVRS
jgi:transposase